VQTIVILFGAVWGLLGVVSESAATAETNHGKAYFLFRVISVIFVSVGTSVIAAGIVFRVVQKRDRFHESLEKAGVLFVGDRNAFDEVIGWDNWILETHRCSELIIIGKDQIKWAEDSAAALGTVLSRGINVTFIFQGEQCDQRLDAFWRKLTEQDTSERFAQWRKNGKLKLCKKQDPNPDYGYYWNGNKLIVKLYFRVPEKREAPFIVFNTSFASGKFDDADFSITCLTHVPFSEKKKMLVQAGVNMCKIGKNAQLAQLN